jgi:hypothetical protein
VARTAALRARIAADPVALVRARRAELLGAAQVQDRTGSVLELRAYSAMR